MQLDFESKKTYIPKFNGNREAAEGEKITVVYQNPTTRMKSRLLPKPKLKFNYDAKGEVEGGETVIDADRSQIINGMLIRIDNLGYTLDGEKKVINNAKALWDAPAAFELLIEELHEKFREELEAGADEKN